MTQNIVQKIGVLYAQCAAIASAAQPLLLFFMRLWVANIFWKSGMVKIADWDSTLYLFNNEYSVPLLPPAIAAVVATCFELACPVFLSLGLLTRAAALPLIGMTAVIQFTYQPQDEHLYWAMLLFTLVLFGPGKISLDYLLGKKFLK